MSIPVPLLSLFMTQLDMVQPLLSDGMYIAYSPVSIILRLLMSTYELLNVRPGFPEQLIIVLSGSSPMISIFLSMFRLCSL